MDEERDEERSARCAAPTTAERSSRPIPESWLELELLRHEVSSGCSVRVRAAPLPPVRVALLACWEGGCWDARLLLLCDRLLLLSLLRGEPLGVAAAVAILSMF